MKKPVYVFPYHTNVVSSFWIRKRNIENGNFCNVVNVHNGKNNRLTSLVTYDKEILKGVMVLFTCTELL